MPDITMCGSKLCVCYKHCYRATAKPSSSQSWALFLLDAMEEGHVLKVKDCKGENCKYWICPHNVPLKEKDKKCNKCKVKLRCLAQN